MLLFYNISFSQIVYRGQFFFWDLPLVFCHFALFVVYGFLLHSFSKMLTEIQAKSRVYQVGVDTSCEYFLLTSP